MASLNLILFATIFLVYVCAGSDKNIYASAQETFIRTEDLGESEIRSKRFIDVIVNTFLDKLHEAFLENASEAKERFVRKMYVAIKNFASEGKDEFIRQLKLAVEELPGAFSSFFSKIIPTVVNFIWSDDGNSPGFQKLRQMVYKEADKMGITGGAGYQCPSLMTSVVLVLATQMWRITAS